MSVVYRRWNKRLVVAVVSAGVGACAASLAIGLVFAFVIVLGPFGVIAAESPAGPVGALVIASVVFGLSSMLLVPATDPGPGESVTRLAATKLGRFSALTGVIALAAWLVLRIAA